MADSDIKDIIVLRYKQTVSALAHIHIVQADHVSVAVCVYNADQFGTYVAYDLFVPIRQSGNCILRHFTRQVRTYVVIDNMRVVPLHRQPDDICPGGGAGGQAQSGGQQEGGGGLGPLLPGGALLFLCPDPGVPLHGGHLPLIPGGGLKGGDVPGIGFRLLLHAVHQYVAHEPVQFLICHICHGCIPSSCANFFSSSRPRAMRVFTAVWVRQSRWAISLLL